MTRLRKIAYIGTTIALLSGCGDGGPATSATGNEGVAARGAAGAIHTAAPGTPVVLDPIKTQSCNGATADQAGGLSVTDDNPTDYTSMWCNISVPVGRKFSAAVLEADVTVSASVSPIIRIDFTDANSTPVGQYDATFTANGDSGTRGEGAKIAAFKNSVGADGMATYSVRLELPDFPAGASAATISFFPAGGVEFQKYDVSAQGAGVMKKLMLTLS